MIARNKRNGKNRKKKKNNQFQVFSVLDENEKLLKTEYNSESLIEILDLTSRDFFEDVDLIKEFRGNYQYGISQQKNVTYQKFKNRVDDLEEILDKYDFNMISVEKFMNERAINVMEDYKYNSGFMGAFLSVMINVAFRKEKEELSDDDHYRTLSIECNLIPKKLEYLGMALQENVMMVINGNTGRALGFANEGGRIECIGDSGNSCGNSMRSGHIEVYGNVDGLTGRSMIDGHIKVRGHAGLDTGAFMEGGIIDVNKDVTTLGDYLYGGKIVVGGKLRAKKHFYHLKNKPQVWIKHRFFSNKYRELFDKNQKNLTYSELMEHV